MDLFKVSEPMEFPANQPRKVKRVKVVDGRGQVVKDLDEAELEERGALAAIFEEAQELHFRKRQDYVRSGKDGGDDLGAAGQYAELHRKDGKLRRALWEGEELIGEQPREILLDMIGHAVKAIRYIDTENLR